MFIGGQMAFTAMFAWTTVCVCWLLLVSRSMVTKNWSQSVTDTASHRQAGKSCLLVYGKEVLLIHQNCLLVMAPWAFGMRLVKCIQIRAINVAGYIKLPIF